MSCHQSLERFLGRQIKVLNHAFGRRLREESSARGLDELTIMHGRILGYLKYNQDRDVFQKDIEEAFNCGETAVLSAVKENETGRVVCMRRESDVPYKISYETADVHKIANVEKKVPSEWITEDYVATEAVDYIRPLIQGELNPVMNDGLPRQIRL